MTAVIGGEDAWLVDDLLRIESILVATAGASEHPLVAEASTHLIKAGGKRLRPALVLVASRAGEPGRGTTDLAAAAIELVHLATLYHDDVIDESDTRRGAPTVHSKWGTSVAVLAGDYLFACGSRLGAEAGGEVPRILATAIAAVCEGQIVETEALGDPARAPVEYLRTIALKTAALFAAAAELGCATSGAPDAHRVALTSYGHHLGVAFQLVDDLLDLVGDPRVTGKAVGTDLREGVFTLPVLLGCERDPGLARSLAAGARDVEAVLDALDATGALTDAKEQAVDQGRKAVRHLEPLPDGRWRATLEGIVTGVLAQV